MPVVLFPDHRRRAKYNNRRVTMPTGEKFDSVAEARRYDDLLKLQRLGFVCDIQRQVDYKLIVNEQLITTYRADFVYKLHGFQIVEDVKGFRTKEYILKRKLMKACLGITIYEHEVTSYVRTGYRNMQG